MYPSLHLVGCFLTTLDDTNLESSPLQRFSYSDHDTYMDNYRMCLLSDQFQLKCSHIHGVAVHSFLVLGSILLCRYTMLGVSLYQEGVIWDFLTETRAAMSLCVSIYICSNASIQGIGPYLGVE